MTNRVALAITAAALLASSFFTAAVPAGAEPRTGAPGSYIVTDSSVKAAEAAVRSAGGTVTATLPIVNGVEAELGRSTLVELSAERTVQLTPNVKVSAAGAGYQAEQTASQLTRLGLAGRWSPDGGSGVGVAFVDTGVAQTPGLNRANIVRSPDFSGQRDNTDGYGHGTFMAGLIAGDGVGGPDAVPGVAPGVTLVAVKVARSDGSTSLSRLIEGIGWAVQHRDQYNIRVMSISFGADIPVPPSQDPLDAAVEAAWASGITVVVSAGNEGHGHVTAPGDDPWVITVGAETTTGAVSSPSWSSYSGSKPDLLAPGVSVTSLRAPGSLIDNEHPSARVGGSYFKGSGTSMATALTAGVAALLVKDHPDATPDDIKGALIAGSGPAVVGRAGPINMSASDDIGASDSWVQDNPIAFYGSRSGTQTMPWASDSTPQSTWDAMSWDAMSWDAMSWDAMSWDAMSWDAMSWDAMSWDAMSWDAMSWDTYGWF